MSKSEGPDNWAYVMDGASHSDLSGAYGPGRAARSLPGTIWLSRQANRSRLNSLLLLLLLLLTSLSSLFLALIKIAAAPFYCSEDFDLDLRLENGSSELWIDLNSLEEFLL